MLFIVNGYIILLHSFDYYVFLLLSINIGAWEKKQQTLISLFFFLFYIISHNDIYEVQRSFVTLDQYNGLLYLGT